MIETLGLLNPWFYALLVIGIIGGIIFGAIPGMTATMAVAVFLPITYAFDIKESLGLLIGLYVGGISGGLVPAILLNMPGTPSSITTTFDGYPMTLQGKGSQALKIGIISSLVGGLISFVILLLFAPLLADVALKFSFVEKFLIILFALTVIASLSKGSMLAGIFSGLLGILFSLIGTYSIMDGGNGKTRLMPEFLQDTLRSGFSLLPVLIGLFAIGLILKEVELGLHDGEIKKVKLEKQKFNFNVFKGEGVNLTRSGLIGTFIGLLPGVGGSAASILSYSQAKTWAKDDSQFGKGNPSGVIASESGNNGLTGGALIPLLALGIPGDSTTAVLIGAFTLQGIQVGPLFIGNNPVIWQTIIIALFLANIVMFLVMYFSINTISKVIYVPKYIMYPIILVMTVVGAYAINYGIMFDVWSLLIFGLLGYFGVKLGLQVAPFIIGVILGGDAEIYFVKSLESFGSWTVFFTKSPIALVLWGLIILSVGYSIYHDTQHKKKLKQTS